MLNAQQVLVIVSEKRFSMFADLFFIASLLRSSKKVKNIFNHYLSIQIFFIHLHTQFKEEVRLFQT